MATSSARFTVFSMPCLVGCTLSCKATAGAYLYTPDPKGVDLSLAAISVDDVLWAVQQISLFHNNCV